MARKARVCVVDDNVEAAKVLAKELRIHDYDTVEAYCGEEALDACNDGEIDLILLDISMPGLDGFQVCERLRENPKTNDIPVVFVTARGEPAAVERGLDLGAIDYITKPYNLPMVLVRVESVLIEHSLKAPMILDHAGTMDSVYTDQVTGLRNRRYLMERLQEEADKGNRYGFPVSLAIFDVDELESLNGSEEAVPLEDILAEVAMVMRSQSRTYDVLARYDDSVFAAVLPHAPLDEAAGYCQKILEEFDYTTLSDPKLPTRAKLTSAAITCRGMQGLTAEEIFAEAMRTLLHAQANPDRRVVSLELTGA